MSQCSIPLVMTRKFFIGHRYVAMQYSTCNGTGRPLFFVRSTLLNRKYFLLFVIRSSAFNRVAYVRIGECPSNSPFLNNNGAEAHWF